MVEENKVETELKKAIEKMGGICYKFVSPGRINVPDRLCALPYGVSFFVECKATGKKPRPGQKRELIRLRKLGHNAYVLDSLVQLDALIVLIQQEILNAINIRRLTQVSEEGDH